jgi:hypothetical protein
LKDREEAAFQALRTAITTELPVLKYTQISDLFVIDPDSSQTTIGAVLQYFLDHRDGKQRLNLIRQQKVKVLEVLWKSSGGTFPGFQAARASSYPPHYSSLEKCRPE